MGKIKDSQICQDCSGSGYISEFKLCPTGAYLDGHTCYSCENGYHTKELLAYNNLLNTDDRIETVLLPIRDGLTISRVKQ